MDAQRWGPNRRNFVDFDPKIVRIHAAQILAHFDFRIVRIHTDRSNRRVVLGSVLYYTSNARREAGQFEVY